MPLWVLYSAVAVTSILYGFSLVSRGRRITERLQTNLFCFNIGCLIAALWGIYSKYPLMNMLYVVIVFFVGHWLGQKIFWSMYNSGR